MRVAVIGASGIGKQHAKWFHLEGCEVAAFAGSSEESVARTAQVLHDLFGFVGTGYASAEAMLAEVNPDIAVIASPPSLHKAHALSALYAGCHVYCEKPLVWDEKKSDALLLQDAREIVDTAHRTGRTMGINTQYVAAISDYISLCGLKAQPVFPRSFFMRMESKGGGGTKTYDRIWTDLASHPISLLLKLCPKGIVDETSVEYQMEEKRSYCRFRFLSRDGQVTSVEFDLRNIAEGALTRRFGVDDVVVDYEGRNDPDGVYRSYLRYETQEMVTADFVQRSIHAFVQSVKSPGSLPLVGGEEGVRNLEVQLQLRTHAVRVEGNQEGDVD